MESQCPRSQQRDWPHRAPSALRAGGILLPIPRQNGASAAVAAARFPLFPTTWPPPARAPHTPARVRGEERGGGGGLPEWAGPAAGARVRTWRFPANRRSRPLAGGEAGLQREAGAVEGRGGRAGERRGGGESQSERGASRLGRRSFAPIGRLGESAGGRAAWRGAYFRSVERAEESGRRQLPVTVRDGAGWGGCGDAGPRAGPAAFAAANSRPRPGRPLMGQRERGTGPGRYGNRGSRVAVCVSVCPPLLSRSSGLLVPVLPSRGEQASGLGRLLHRQHRPWGRGAG